MAQINRWKCDICGKEFGEDDAGYKTCDKLYIMIRMIPGVLAEEIGFDDTCSNCRTIIADAIGEKIIELQN